jgi:hypothetical protein
MALGKCVLHGPCNVLHPITLGSISIVGRQGEISNTDAVIGLAARNRLHNRVFTIGVGAADAGLVEGLAQATSGRADFLTDVRNLSATAISQLESSRSSALGELQLHLPDSQLAEVSPFPLPRICRAVSVTFFAKCPRAVASILLTISSLDIPIQARRSRLDVIAALHSYETI